MLGSVQTETTRGYVEQGCIVKPPVALIYQNCGASIIFGSEQTENLVSHV